MAPVITLVGLSAGGDQRTAHIFRMVALPALARLIMAAVMSAAPARGIG